MRTRHETEYVSVIQIMCFCFCFASRFCMTQHLAVTIVGKI